MSRPSRIDRQHFDAIDFPIRVEVPIRFDDLDVLGHVNNAAAAAILQEGRVAFNQSAALPSLGSGLRPVVAGLRIEFALELHYPGVIEVCTGIVSIGRTSFTMAQVGRQDGRGALYGEVTLVITGANGPAPIPDELRTAIQQLRVPSPR